MLGRDRRRCTPERWTSTLRTAGCASGLKWGLLVLMLVELPAPAVAAPWSGKLLHRLVAPFRSNPVWQDRTKPCNLGFASCFLPDDAPRAESPASEFEFVTEDPARAVTLELRALHGGPFAHHWLQVESSIGAVTLGFGPATVPFIDAGQISLQDRYRQHRANFGNASGAGLGPATPELPVRKNTRGRAPSGQTDPANGCAGGCPHPKNTPSQVCRPLHPDLPRLPDIRVQRSGSGPRTVVPALLFAVQRLLVGELSEACKCTTSLLPSFIERRVSKRARPASRPDSTRLQFTSMAAYRAGGMRDATARAT